MPAALILRAAGTNCDGELVRAFQLAGAATTLLHLDRLIDDPARLEAYDIVAVAGGFSYGDDIASGRIFAARMRRRLYPALRDAARRGSLMFGVCNGFQVFVQAGLLPGPDGGVWPEDQPPAQETALTFNAGGRFVDGWFGIEAPSAAESPCVWTRGLGEAYPPSLRADVMKLPIAHGEGRFVAPPEVISRLRRSGQVALRYASGDNPNGSQGDIAGICDPSGRIFGLMPHPERYLEWTRHPYWTRLDPALRSLPTPGLTMFRNAVLAAETAKV